MSQANAKPLLTTKSKVALILLYDYRINCTDVFYSSVK